MVNAARVKKKIPSLLVNGNTTEKAYYNKLMRMRYGFIKLERKNRNKYNAVVNRVVAALVEAEKAINSVVRD